MAALETATGSAGPTFGLESTELDVMDGLFFNELTDLPVDPTDNFARAAPAVSSDGGPLTDEELIASLPLPSERAAAAVKEEPAPPPPPPAKPAAKAPAAAPAASTKGARDAAELSETRRARNREHARRSRCRKKLIIESLQQSLVAYQDENARLRAFVREKLGEEEATPRLEWCAARSKGEAPDPFDASLTTGGDGARMLNKYDYGLLEALKHARRSFVITDPTLPDNPIVFASGGFLSLTGYKLEQVLGRNCRFLQGPRTDARAVAKIRDAIKHGKDVQIVLLNYKIDSTTFWNHFFIAALRDDKGDVVNFLGVQIEVSERVAMGILQDAEGRAKEPAKGAAVQAAAAAAAAKLPPKAGTKRKADAS